MKDSATTQAQCTHEAVELINLSLLRCGGHAMLGALWRRMDIALQNHSSYPRTGDQPGQRDLRYAHAARGRGAISASEFAVIERAQIDAAIHEQEQAGLDIVTDGQMRWSDPISHVMGTLDGVRIGGLLRFFDTEGYFRQPVVTAAIRRRAPICRDDFTTACYATRRVVKPVLPGPYTLARLCLLQSGPYRDVAELAYALSEVLAAEVSELVGAGARMIQIDEPAILAHPGDVRLLRQLLEPLSAAGAGAQLVVATYFGDAEPLYAQLNSLPGDILALDFTSSPRLLEVIAATGASKVLALGLIDGRTTGLEDVNTVARQVDRILQHYVLDSMHLLPSCGLEYLARDRARAKLGLLAQVRKLVGSGA
jgi:5-methyltetrahydropteroyltriglutamate--homocysteine methyltransferase